MKPLIKLSPSKLETWRKYQAEEYGGFITKEKVVEAITGAGEWSKEATFGAAIHLVLQHGAHRYATARLNDEGKMLFEIQDREMPEPVVLTYDELRLADQFHMKHPAMIWEIPGTLWLDVDEYRVLMNFRIDSMEGLVVHENKTSKRDMSFDFFEESLQWRVYLLATGAPCAQYNVFSYDEPNTKRRAYELYYDHLVLFPYEEMIDDVRQAVRGCVEFCKLQGLMDHLIVKPKHQ